MNENQVEVHGHVASEFSSVRDLFAANLQSGLDVGASFCAMVQDETVIDVWGGWADAAKTRPWQSDTIGSVYSTVKQMVALCALVLVDRGELDLDEPVAKYWPEFAANGKAKIKVRHLLTHMAGLPAWPQPLTLEDLSDWQKVTTILAQQMPQWAPGTAWGYHANTQGFLVGEVVRRVSGRSLGTFFREEIAQPLEADFHFTLAEADDHRVADLIPPTGGPPPGMQLNQLLLTMFSDPSRDPELTKTRAWRSAEMPAISGFGNARSIAKIQSLLANGGIANGKQILSEKTCRQVLELNFEGFDVCTGAPTRQGLGYYLIPGSHVMPSHNIAYGGGFGGSLVVVDFDSRVTCAYVMNKMIAGPNLRGMALTMATWSAMVNRTLAG